MEIQEIVLQVRAKMQDHKRYCENIRTAERYFKGDQDINRIHKSMGLSSADSRLASNLYYLDVTQEAGYAMTYPPQPKTGEPDTDKKLMGILGAGYDQYCRDLWINGCNQGEAWSHYWIEDGFEYAVIDRKNMIPVYENSLKEKLGGVCHWWVVPGDTPELIINVWNDHQLARWVVPAGGRYETDIFGGREVFIDSVSIPDRAPDQMFTHTLGEVPFIRHKSSITGLPDLMQVKDYIDALNLMQSQFVDNLQAWAEAFYILTGYNGENEAEFLEKVRKFKVVMMQSMSLDGKTTGELKTVTQDVPYEARKTIIDLLEKLIIKYLQMFDPDPDVWGESSGVAINHKFRPLEMKVGAKQVGYKIGFDQLYRAALRASGISVEIIDQKWTRNKMDSLADMSIDERTELAVKAAALRIISNEDILTTYFAQEFPDPSAVIERFKEENGLEY